MDQHTDFSREEVCERGQKIIDETLAPEIVESRRGQMVAVDILTGKMGFGRTGIAAKKELVKLTKDPVTYIGRVGYRAAYHIGGSSMKIEK